MRQILPLDSQLTVGGLLSRAVQRFPDRPALKYMGQVWTYREFEQRVDYFSRCLLSWGVKHGSHVGIWAEAEPNTVFLIYATARIGAVAALLNTSLGRDEVEALISNSDISLLIIGDGYKELAYPELCRGLCDEVPCLENILYIGRESRCGFRPFQEPEELVKEEALSTAQKAVKPEDTAYIIYTSGTTSLPKAVLDSQFSRANCAMQQAYDLEATEKDSFCVTMPIFHCFSLTVNVFSACAVGACLYLPEQRRTKYILEAIQYGKCTVCSGVPAMFHAIISRPDFDEWDTSSLRAGLIGGSFCTLELFEKIEKSLGFTLLSSLGQTEATSAVTTAYMDDSLEVRAATVGHFMSHVEGKIVSIDNGMTLPNGEAGEICIKGYNVMRGYYKNEEQTKKTVDAQGWLHTGDMGWLDDNGNIHLTGRLKDLIIRGGENISPMEIEDVLAGVSSISERCAIAVPDDHYGEEVCLCLVAKDGAEPDITAIRELLSRHLAAYKVPRYIITLPELPKTATGKVRKQELKNTACDILRQLNT